MPLVGPPRPMSGPVPSSVVTGAAGVAVTGGRALGTAVGATSGGAGVEFVVTGRPLPPLLPGDVAALSCGSSRKLIRSG